MHWPERRWLHLSGFCTRKEEIPEELVLQNDDHMQRTQSDTLHW
jgi:hypothetical protein